MKCAIHRFGNIIKAVFGLFACVFACACLVACADGGQAAAPIESNPAYSSGVHHAQVSVEGYEPFVIVLDADQAPVTVQNFCDLAESGFYDGLTFHRVVDGFCLQGGDPKGDGTGGSSQKIKGEFSSNGVQNELADNYARGVVAMARSRSNDSASCQFFITLSDRAAMSLNGEYAAFGTVDEQGMAVVDAVVRDYLPAATGAHGSIPNKADQPVIASIQILD